MNRDSLLDKVSVVVLIHKSHLPFMLGRALVLDNRPLVFLPLAIFISSIGVENRLDMLQNLLRESHVGVGVCRMEGRDNSYTTSGTCDASDLALSGLPRLPLLEVVEVWEGWWISW